MLTIAVIIIQFCTFLGAVTGKIYDNQYLFDISNIIYGLIQLGAVVSFIPSVNYFISRKHKNNGGHSSFIEDKWPWILIDLNIFRNIGILLGAILFFIVTITKTTDGFAELAPIANGIVFIIVPVIDLCTGMSILFLYHILAKDKRCHS